MASYNFMKAADRVRCIKDRQAEIDAIKAGTWPRDINDSMRWTGAPTNPFLSAAENHRIRTEYATKMCQAEIDYLINVDFRIDAGDPDLAGWEPVSVFAPSMIKSQGEPVTVPLDGCCCKCRGLIPAGTEALFVRNTGLFCRTCQE